MKSLSKVLIILLLSYSIPRIAYGDDTQINDLRNRVAALETEVAAMNVTLLKMMAIIDSSPSISKSQLSGTGTGVSTGGVGTSTQSKWQDKQNWRKLRSGMSKSEVTDLLGEPTRIDNFGIFEDWQYGLGGGASVRFSSEARLDSWHEP